MNAQRMIAVSPGNDILAAVSMSADRDRVEALRRVALLLHRNGEPANAGTSIRAEVLAVLHNQAMARAYHTLRDLSLSREIDELNVMDFAKLGDYPQTVCAIAHLAYLPVDAADRLFAIDNAQLLLVVCRAQNFAWSTVRLLLALRASGPPAAGVERNLCDDYHAMPPMMAQRFGRFLRAHFEVDARPPVQPA